jgi:hypothetical protein
MDPIMLNQLTIDFWLMSTVESELCEIR